jgi:hypothetical protein
MGRRSHDRRGGLRLDRPGAGNAQAREVLAAPPPRPYLNAQQLAEVTPWSVNAIEKMVSRGVFKLGVHYFQPGGHRTQLIFKWSAIIEFVEGLSETSKASPAPVLLRKGPLDVQQAAEELHRLLGR